MIASGAVDYIRCLVASASLMRCSTWPSTRTAWRDSPCTTALDTHRRPSAVALSRIAAVCQRVELLNGGALDGTMRSNKDELGQSIAGDAAFNARSLLAGS